ncbi:GTA baseplate fiber-binding domain-containing protein [Pelagerythrobacter marinus]|uniref:GTA baseplate fiber-binding domain-containing protein n=1 Tax=Pelagerythrobacter marinus TaxID=538382 RepID=UPI0020374C81|nr:phage tail protein [Pelagerythrobacter marinus]USA39028.1 phage tail protein [Pelagerythrobacter marinus]WPZ06887.1 phage tail protein [Pelagerythrobacter marinus]
MATLVLGTIGTLVGGPLGGALGTIVGRGIDGAVIGTGRREGPRLKDLAVTTSSYGQPLPRHFGRMRVAGSVIWATDLVENRETGGGGKGRPKTTTYSYSSSFAVALSSRPIAGLGRIWADGKLLRGAAGDLKVGGALRVYRGHGDQAPDPLIAADAGGACPAFRGCAYAVFEDLELADFGNRIPALTFEVLADAGGFALSDLVGPLVPGARGEVALAGLEGFSYEGGPLRESLATIDRLFPLAADTAGGGIALAGAYPPAATAIDLPEPVLAPGRDGAEAWEGPRFEREAGPLPAPSALRYYDVARDYQPGLQRAASAGGDNEDGRAIEFPGALAPDRARTLAGAAAVRARARGTRLSLRIAELDPALGPGKLARVPGVEGLWLVESWEWDEHGIALDLRRHALAAAAEADLPGDAGRPALPRDGATPPTLLRAFELPWDGRGDPARPPAFAAASAADAGWRGASLYLEDGGVLEEIGPSGQARSIGGTLAGALGASPARLLERQASIALDLHAPDMVLASAGAEALAAGANRLLVGREVLQYARAVQEGARRWRLEGLLRGRGGTEAAAGAGHPAGTAVTLIDAALLPIGDRLTPGTPAPRVAAIGQADDAPVIAPIEGHGEGLRPLAPVHPRARLLPSGALALGWTRRARGAWQWLPEVDAPLVEQAELYRLGAGPPEAPLRTWDIAEPHFTIAPADRAALAADMPGAPVWVRQVGSFAASDPLVLATLD